MGVSLSVYYAWRTSLAAYIRYYNHQRLHTANGDLAPVTFEPMTLKNVS
ncbi:IS3 family transposase [Thiolinea disciformis]